MPTFENEKKNWYSKFRNFNTHQPSGDGYTGGAQGTRKIEFQNNMNDSGDKKSTNTDQSHKPQ